MVAWTHTPARSNTSLLSLFGKWFSKSQVAIKAFLVVFLRVSLVIAGLASISVAAWIVHMSLGFLVIGVALLVLEWVVKR
jgi:hypothetical protein